MAKSNLPNQYVQESIEFTTLYLNGSQRTSTGNPTWTSSSSGVTYTVTNNTGENGLMALIQAAIQDYYIFAADINSKVSMADLLAYAWTWGDLYNP